MPDSLPSVLTAASDEDLCAGVFALLQAHHGNRFDPAGVPDSHRIVMLVWYSQGVISTSGFNGFLGADLPGDPEYRLTRTAYDAVGCEPAAAAVQRVFDIYPDHTPPADPRSRVQMFGKANHAVHGALNRDFIRAQSALTAALARFIREHSDEFDGIDQPGERGPGLIESGPASAEVDPSRAAVLPHWAQAAFFARCARHVLPFWDEAWPAAPPDYKEVVEQAIRMAERSAAEARPIGEPKMAANHAARVASAALAAEEGRPSPDVPPQHPQRAALIAAGAGSALDFISREDDTGSYPFARLVIEDLDLIDLMDDLREDFSRLVQLADEGEWNDRTPVPPEVFDPNYKPSDKKWWKKWRG